VPSGENASAVTRSLGPFKSGVSLRLTPTRCRAIGVSTSGSEVGPCNGTLEYRGFSSTWGRAGCSLTRELTIFKVIMTSEKTAMATTKVGTAAAFPAILEILDELVQPRPTPCGRLVGCESLGGHGRCSLVYSLYASAYLISGTSLKKELNETHAPGRLFNDLPCNPNLTLQSRDLAAGAARRTRTL